MNLKLFDSLDKGSKLLVAGYTREIQNELPKQIAYYIIPISISMICTLYYVTPVDKWNPEIITSRMEISGKHVG